MVRQESIVPNDYAVPDQRDNVVFSAVLGLEPNIEKRSQGLFGTICSRGSVNAVFQQVADKRISSVANYRGRPTVIVLLTLGPRIFLALLVNLKSGSCDSSLIRIVVDQNGSVVLKAGILKGFKLCSHTR